MNPPPRRFFLGWDEPVVQSVGGFLPGHLGNKKHTTAPVVVVPTRQAERLLREYLARETEPGPLTVCTPGNLPEILLANPPETPPELCRALWLATLRDAPKPRIAPIFGNTRDHSPRALFRCLDFVIGCRQTLAESLLDFTSMAALPAVCEGVDARRWQGLQWLEADYRQRLGEAGLVDRDDHFQRAISQGQLAEPLPRQVVLAVCPDVPKRSLAILAALPPSVEIVILVAAPGDQADQFCPYGLPLPESFSRQPLPLAESSIKHHPGLSSFLRETGDYLRRVPDRTGRALLGALDTSAVAAATYELAAMGIPVFDPSGESLGRSAGGLYLSSLHSALTQEAIEPLDILLRHPFFLEYLQQGNFSADPEAFLVEWDHFRAAHFPRRCQNLLPLLRTRRAASASLLRPVLEQWEVLQHEFHRAGGFFFLIEGPLGQGLLQPLQRDQGFQRICDILKPARACLLERQSLLQLSGAETDSLLLRLINRSRSVPTRQDGSVEVLGWLELAWDARPELFLLDAFEGRLPTPLEENPLLPQFLREAVGLPHRQTRLERDAYLLRLLAELRKTTGQIVIALPPVDDRQEPVHPSRFLFSVPSDQLPARVLFLTREAAPPPPLTEVSRAPALKPSSPQVWLDQLTSVSASQFKSYLRHPFEFYLEQVLGMQRPASDRLEMDPASFGHLAHAVIEAVEIDEELADCDSPETLRRAYRHHLDTRFQQLYGQQANAFLLMQRESLFNRLAHLADHRADDRARGWRVERVEWRLHADLPLLIAGLPLHGKVDLIERRHGDGQLRIVDFKTTDTNEGPAAAHCREASRSIPPRPAYPLKTRTGLFWKDLQLPLYAEAVSRHFQTASVEVGYYALTRAVSEIGWLPWMDFTPDFQEDALACAHEIVADWRDGRFALPGGKLLSEDFAALSNRTDLSEWQAGYLKEAR